MSTFLEASRSTKRILLQLGAKKRRILQSFPYPGDSNLLYDQMLPINLWSDPVLRNRSLFFLSAATSIHRSKHYTLPSGISPESRYFVVSEFTQYNARDERIYSRSSSGVIAARKISSDRSPRGFCATMSSEGPGLITYVSPSSLLM